MKRHQADQGNFFLLNALDETARAEGVSILDSKAKEQLLEKVRKSLDEHQKHSARVHGFHVQSMFAHIAASLGQCEIITEEDSGAFFDESGMIRPDLRIKTRTSGQMLVEVKAHHKERAPYRLKGPYLKSVKQYARTFGVPLKFAVYWSRWNLWTLLDADQFDESQPKITVKMTEAFMANEMYLLGDAMIGTIPPLSIRVYPVKSTVRRSVTQFQFQTERVCLCGGGVDLLDKTDAELALYLMLYGEWRNHDRVSNFSDDGTLEYVETRVSPEDFPDHAEHDFGNMRTLGYQSSMLSSRYRHVTTFGGEIKNLVPGFQPDKLRVPLPEKIGGRVLQLWHFTMLPRHLDHEAYLASRRPAHPS